MIRIPFLVAAVAAVAASENDAVQNDLRRASESRAREAAYLEQAYAPNLGSGGIDVHAAGRRLADGIRARAEADAAERAASEARYRAWQAAEAEERAAAAAAEARYQSAKQRKAREETDAQLSQLLTDQTAALAQVPPSARDKAGWHRLLAARLKRWSWSGKNYNQREEARADLQAGAAAGIDAAKAVLVVLDAPALRQLDAAVVADLDAWVAARPAAAPLCGLLAAAGRAGVVMPNDVSYFSVMEDMFHESPSLVGRLGLEIHRRAVSHAVPADVRPALARDLAVLAGAADPAVAMPAWAALRALDPAAPRSSLTVIWSEPGVPAGDAFREWAFFTHLLNGVAASARGDHGVLDALLADLAAHPAALGRLDRARAAWALLRRDAGGWSIPDGTTVALGRPVSPWEQPYERLANAPARWLVFGAALNDARNRTHVKDNSLDFGNGNIIVSVTTTIPDRVAWLPGDLPDPRLHPLTWTAIQDDIGLRAAALAAASDTPAALSRFAAGIASEVLGAAAGGHRIELPTLESHARDDLRRLLLARARTAAQLAAAIEAGAAGGDPAAWHLLDAGELAWRALATDRMADETPEESAWLPALVVRLAQGVDPGPHGLPSYHLARASGMPDWRQLAACLALRIQIAQQIQAGGIACAPEHQAVIDRQAAWWRSVPGLP